MRKVIVCLIGVLLLNQPLHAHNLAEVIEVVLPSITYIEVERHTDRKIIDTQNKSITTVRERGASSAGTGFVVEQNKIVTNFHVISRAVEDDEKIFVKFHENNGVRYEALVLGYDEVADVALLQISGKHPSLSLSNSSDDMRMGEEIFTISNYYSIRHSATTGIVSSNNRADRRYPYIRLLQLQILQGSGSSGGPVMNAEGEVVALNHTILSMVPDTVYKTEHPSLMSMSAFTIRGDQLATSIRRIKEEGIVVRMDLGIYLKSYGMTSEQFLYDPIDSSTGVTGVVVLSGDKDTLEQFKPNDIIVSIDGRPFSNAAALLIWLDSQRKIGDIVKLQVYRDGTFINITTEVKAARRYR